MGLVAVLAQSRDGGVVVGLVDVHRVVDVDTAASCRDPDLRGPEPDPGPRPGRHPHAILGALGDWEPEHARVEALGRQLEGQVYRAGVSAVASP